MPEKIALTKSRKASYIDELIRRYAVSNQADGKSPKTISWYNEMLGAFCGYFHASFDHCDLVLLDISKVREYVIYLQHKPNNNKRGNRSEQEVLLSPTTVQGHVRALKAFASWLFAEGYTDTNRLQNLKVPKAPAKMFDPLKPSEIKKIITVIDKKSLTGARNLALVNLLLDSGLRASGAVGITLPNVNLEDGFIKVM
ncbi:tyrosine-type recombinase/integrase, partial [Chloroflexota bacterium]